MCRGKTVQNICPSGLFCIRTNFLPSPTNTIISNWNKLLNGISRGQNVYWSACTKPTKWVVMYLCVMGIEFAPFNDLSIGVWNVPTVWYFCFSFYHWVNFYVYVWQEYWFLLNIETFLLYFLFFIMFKRNIDFMCNYG